MKLGPAPVFSAAAAAVYAMQRIFPFERIPNLPQMTTSWMFTMKIVSSLSLVLLQVLPSATSDVPRPAQPLNESSGGIVALVRWKSITAHLDGDFVAQQIMVRPRFNIAHLNADLVARQMTCPFGVGSVFCPDGISCCPPGKVCAGGDTCCPSDSFLCSNGNCCPVGTDCFGTDGCCPIGENCVDTGCPTGFFMCLDGSCCPTGSTCNGGQCDAITVTTSTTVHDTTEAPETTHTSPEIVHETTMMPTETTTSTAVAPVPPGTSLHDSTMTSIVSKPTSSPKNTIPVPVGVSTSKSKSKPAKLNEGIRQHVSKAAALAYAFWIIVAFATKLIGF